MATVNPIASDISINQFGNVVPTATPFVISGLKANQPGNLNSAGSNTLPASQLASASNQVAGGSVPSTYSGPSIVDYLNSQGKPSDYNTRSQLASQYGITGYTGTAAQNTQLLGMLQKGTAPAQTYLPGSTGNTGAAPADTASGNFPPGGFTTAIPAYPTNPPPQSTGNVTTQNSTSAAYSPTNSTQQVASNISPSGLLQNQIGQSQQLYQQQQQNAQQIIQDNQKVLGSAMQELEQLTGGSYSGTAADYSGRAAQLANLIQSAQSNINQANANLSQYSQQAQSALSDGVAATSQLQASPYGTPQVNPVTGQVISGGQNVTPGATGSVAPTYNPTTDAQNFARAVMSGSMTYAQAQDSLSYAGSVGTTALNNAILAAGGNPLTLQAQGAATQSNIQTASTAATGAAATGLQQATQNYVNANTAYTTAQNQAANLQQVLNSTGINQSPQFVNQKINALQNQLGSANYTSFITALTELQQKYTNLLSTVGAQTPTVNGVQATTILNPNSTPAQINAAIDALNNAAYAQLKPLYDQIGTYAGQLGGGTNTNAQSTSVSPWH